MKPKIDCFEWNFCVCVRACVCVYIQSWIPFQRCVSEFALADSVSFDISTVAMISNAFDVFICLLSFLSTFSTLTQLHDIDKVLLCFAYVLFYFGSLRWRKYSKCEKKSKKKKNQYNGRALFQCMKTVSAHVVRVYVKMFIDSIESSVRLSAPPFSAAAAATAVAFLCLCILCRYRARSTTKHTSVCFDQLVAL